MLADTVVLYFVAMLFVLGYFCATNEDWKLDDFGLLSGMVSAMTLKT